MLTPIICHGQGPTDVPPARARRLRLLHLFAGVGFLGSFGVQHALSERAGLILRGVIIGHGGSRGSHYHATVAMVKYLGLDADKDVKLISTIDVTQGLTALFSGAVGAATLSPPYDSIAVRKGFKRLVSGPDILPRFVENGLVVRRAKLKDNPDQIRRMLRALVRGLHYGIDRPSDAVALIQKDWNLERETAQEAYDAAIPTYNLKGEGGDEIIAAAIKRAQQDAKITASNFAPKDYVDWTLIRTVQREIKR